MSLMNLEILGECEVQIRRPGASHGVNGRVAPELVWPGRLECARVKPSLKRSLRTGQVWVMEQNGLADTCAVPLADRFIDINGKPASFGKDTGHLPTPDHRTGQPVQVEPRQLPDPGREEYVCDCAN